MTETLFPGCELRDLSVNGDERGSLVACEAGKEVPFPISRVYYLYDTQPSVARGFHAHRKLRQFAVCISGSCIMMLDDGRQRKDVRLDRPSLGLTIPPAIWHEMREFTPDSVLLVFADAPYDESDYIRDYDRFLASVGPLAA